MSIKIDDQVWQKALAITIPFSPVKGVVGWNKDSKCILTLGGRLAQWAHPPVHGLRDTERLDRSC